MSYTETNEQSVAALRKASVLRTTQAMRNEVRELCKKYNFSSLPIEIQQASRLLQALEIDLTTC